jgi:hypothetical protein
MAVALTAFFNSEGASMPRFKVAHLHERGQDMIIVPLDWSFGHRISQDQQDIITDLQIRARSAGLAGTVVPVWDSGGGRMAFIAPRPWHPFLQSINLRFVAVNINGELYW